MHANKQIQQGGLRDITLIMQINNVIVASSIETNVKNHKE